MKKHQTLYIAGAALLLIGGYMYMKKSSNKMNTVPPMEADTTATIDNQNPTTSTGNTLGGASQVIDSIKGLIAEIKTKSSNAVKTIVKQRKNMMI
jgi:hypothetical protein